MQIPVLTSVLTQTENVVVGQVLSGKANKNIAGDLMLSQRTIEVHRANVFQKMRVRNAIELVKLLSSYQKDSDHGRQVRPVWFSSSDTESTSGCRLRCVSSVGFT